ncbi:MAG: hypothetical protein U0T77_01340 [Chitinophagales bacterium]
MRNKTFFRGMVAIAAIVFAATTTGCQKETTAPVTEAVSATGDSASIVSSLARFRSLLGDSLNTAPGKTGGRREINWDAVPPSLNDNNLFPGNFFAQTDSLLPNGRKRGATFTSSVAEDFRISSLGFEDVKAGFSAQFKRFSPKLIFGLMKTNTVDITFKVPGTSTDATVKGFGVIFLGVDAENKTGMEFFDLEGNSLGKFYAKAYGSGYSFLGVKFKDANTVAKVRITAGEEGIGEISSYKDKVAMDDFLYDEPVAQ